MDPDIITTSDGYSLTVSDLNEAMKDLKAAYQTAANNAVFTANTFTFTSGPTFTIVDEGGGIVVRPIWGDPEPEPAADETFYTEYPILGFRGIDFSAGTFKGGYGGSWGVGMHAMHCNITSGTQNPHLTFPGWTCNCGIYAHKKSFIEFCSGRLFTLVAMENVIEHELGYRAGRAWVIAAAWRDEPDWGNLDIDAKRANLLIEHTWPMQPMVCRSVEKLLKVEDFYLKNPDRIPVPTDEYWTLARNGRFKL